MLGVGVAAWVYNKVMNQTGGNTQNALTIAAVSGGIALIITLTVLSMIDG